jgi:hypothetical protein
MNSALSNISLKSGAVDLVRYAVYFAVCVGLIVGVVWLTQRMTCRRTGGGQWYEGFTNSADERLAGIQQRLRSVRDIRALLEQDIEDLGIAGDDTCDILKQIEERYVGNAAAPSDETEYALSPELQQRRQIDRRTRAQARFQEEQRIYAALHGAEGVLECFTGQGSATEADVTAAEDALAAELEDLLTVLDTSEIQATLQKGRKIQSLLGFNAKYLQKGLESTQRAVEAFVSNPNSGGALLARADDLIGRASSIHTQLKEIQGAVAQQKRAAAEMNRASARVAAGNISAGDLQAAVS